jgi:methylated-DNA-protein-cysteine methyltransferase-like protein
VKRDAESGRFFEAVYDVVRRVPVGRVTTYGAVSEILTGRKGAARTVGWALHGLPPEIVDEVPWWRVINARGRISTSCEIHSADEQRARLEDEGIVFGDDGRVDLGRFGWWGEGTG